jgi:hypothetical protein
MESTGAIYHLILELFKFRDSDILALVRVEIGIS